MFPSYRNVSVAKEAFLVAHLALSDWFFGRDVHLPLESARSLFTIRIYHKFVGRIEKSIPTIVSWHRDACRVMTNGDPEGRIFLSYPHTNNEFFLLFTIFLNFKISFQKSLNTLRCNFT